MYGQVRRSPSPARPATVRLTETPQPLTSPAFTGRVRRSPSPARPTAAQRSQNSTPGNETPLSRQDLRRLSYQTPLPHARNRTLGNATPLSTVTPSGDGYAEQDGMLGGDRWIRQLEEQALSLRSDIRVDIEIRVDVVSPDTDACRSLPSCRTCSLLCTC